ncbi:MAG: TonB-dependent receptor [Bacteroidetes bacterium]|nr:TonB-dependent receptor [Bacteroidota bacterium]
MKRKSIIFRISFVFLLFLAVCTAYGQKGTVTGTVSEENGETLPGASVVIEGTTVGTSTDIDGNYKLENVEPGIRTIVISFIGLKSQKHEAQVKAGQTVTLDVILKPDALMLEDVVVIGYGRRQKRDVTGSMETIKAKELTEQVVPSFEQAMQGRAAGVQVTAANGIAGSPVKINIRGVSSITAGSEPLYVIDGIPMTTGDFSPGSLGSGTSALADLNPNDIESIDILKDAAAAAIYGSRGSNGVVIITTKKGNQGKTKFNAGYFRGVVQETNRMELLSAQEHLALIDSARSANGDDPMDPDDEIYSYNNWTRRQADSLAALGGTDWIDQVLQIGSVQEANLSASGGTEKTVFYIGGTYRKEEGFIIGNTFERINGRINLENEATKRLKIGTNTGLSYTTNHRVPTGDAGGLGQAQQLPPYIPVYDDEGNYFDPKANPLWQLENRKFKAEIFRSITKLYADYQIIDGLSFRSEYGLDVLNQIEDEFNYRNILDTTDKSSAWDRRTSVYNWTTNNYFTYNKVFKEIHDASFTLGNSIQRSRTKGVGLYGYDFPNDYFTLPSAASAINQSGYCYYTAYAFTSNFFRVNYKLKDRYLVGISIRNDGSSRFGDDVRYGWFPAISAGWIITDETFMDSIPYLTFLKLRASLGQTGNANIGDYTHLGYFGPAGNYSDTMSIAPYNLPNENLTWEKATQLDVTLDYAFLDNRFAGTFTYYYKYTYDMLLAKTLPTSTGYSSIMMNIGAMKNWGYEFTFSSKNLNGKFKWSTDLNFAINRNEVTDAAGLPPDAFESGQPGEGRVIVGYPVGQSYVVRYAGTAKEDMVIMEYDLNGNPMDSVQVTAGQDLYYDIHGNLMTSGHSQFYDNRVPCGNPYPKFLGGITNTFSWKGFDLSFLFGVALGNYLYDDPAKRQIGDYNRIAQREDILDYWSEDNPDSDVPGLGYNTYSTNSDRFLYNASYIRLRNLTFGYKIPENLCKKLHIISMRVYMTATNLWTWTKYPGWDPEVLRNVDPNSQQGNISFAGPSFQTPQAKTISCGVQVSF